MPQPLIAITGSTGTVGGMVAARLADQGANLRLIVRDPSTAPSIVGVDLATASDYSATDEMTDALRGSDTLFLVSGREAENRLEQHYSAIDAAIAAGVSRVVYTSFLGAAPDATFTLARTHYATEQALIQSGMSYAIQRQSLYLDFMPFMAGRDGVIRGPAGDGRFAPVARTDVADVAVALLDDDSRDGQIYNVTGDERVSFRHIANRMTALTGKAVEYVHESAEEAYASRAHFGAPDWEVEGWVSSYLAIAAGEMDVVTDVVKELTGHDPLSLDSYLADNPESWAHIEPSAL
ncbi:MAG: SDR family oxidoreductase [Solirubrobacterales bacterium]